jgi:leucyl aminopeptidase
MMKVTFAEPKLPTRGVLFVGVTAGEKLSATAKLLDQKAKGALARAVKAGRFSGKLGQTHPVLGPAGLENLKIVLVGTGDPKKQDALSLRRLGAKLVERMRQDGERDAVFAYDGGGKGSSSAEASAEVAYGAVLRAYQFDRYFTKKDKEKKTAPAKLGLLVAGAPAARQTYRRLDAVARALDFARDLVSEPGNVIYPETLADACVSLRKLGVSVQVLGEPQMEKLGMGALLGVGHGSARESRLVVMRWNGASKSRKPVAFVGKGVTFDTGGISIKPAGGMEDMKWDMGGAAAVIGAIYALAARKAKANAIGVVGLVENMPSGTAQRPGDIVTSMSGQTIEVLNTDAEGRLVLADALWYTQSKFKPQIMVDLATLTGAIMVALGHEYGGLFSNNDELADKLQSAGTAVGEPLWRMPLNDAYDKQINSDAADMKNIGAGRWAGSATAAQFLQRFTNEVPWAHLDIAGMAWAYKAKETMGKGATGFGVQLLDRLVADHYE